MKYDPGARLAGIVGGVVSAASFPIGTAACVYAMWFFFGENWKSVYYEQQMDELGNEFGMLTPGDQDRAAAFDFEDQVTRDPKPVDWR